MMPIRPENRARYPKNWKQIVEKVRKRSCNRCEFYFDGMGKREPKGHRFSNRCEAINGQPHPDTGSKVFLTVSHLYHTPENNSMTNLRYACQKCHNSYDAPMRAAGIKKRAKEKCAIGELI